MINDHYCIEYQKLRCVVSMKNHLLKNKVPQNNLIKKVVLSDGF